MYEMIAYLSGVVADETETAEVASPVALLCHCETLHVNCKHKISRNDYSLCHRYLPAVDLPLFSLQLQWHLQFRYCSLLHRLQMLHDERDGSSMVAGCSD